ncbi:hypothetical protein Lal_00000391 [Lupinus albus]|uniref:Uncharacterized protein n=1 Tax=Lupinus albus TaxID=3870 RepID=A0A6A5LI47_LUPAL|nr:hypothetical protein Lalb_Chr21g0308451 [Lupinus albus]KAF1860976.1 hypothetical protein Lal_00000391 [Lupinus albus]
MFSLWVPRRVLCSTRQQRLYTLAVRGVTSHHNRISLPTVDGNLNWVVKNVDDDGLGGATKDVLWFGVVGCHDRVRWWGHMCRSLRESPLSNYL